MECGGGGCCCPFLFRPLLFALLLFFGRRSVAGQSPRRTGAETTAEEQNRGADGRDGGKKETRGWLADAPAGAAFQ
jgi:hypothetical protein